MNGNLEIEMPPLAAPDRFVGAGAGQSIRRLPARVLLAMIAAYQRFLSPVLPVVTLGACACRFAPTCSQYAADAIKTHGAIAGACLALRRLVKCTPLHPGGIDPVPPRSRPRCHRPITLPRSLLSP